MGERGDSMKRLARSTRYWVQHFVGTRKYLLSEWMTDKEAWEQIVVVILQLPSHVWLFATSWNAACQASLSFTISWSLPKFMFFASAMLSSHLIIWCPLFFLSSIIPSIRDFSNESSVHIRWPKYWSFSFSISNLEAPGGPWLVAASLQLLPASSWMFQWQVGRGSVRDEPVTFYTRNWNLLIL